MSRCPAGFDIALCLPEWEAEHQAGSYLPRETKNLAHRSEPQPDSEALIGASTG
jgi:hypothetical protein